MTSNFKKHATTAAAAILSLGSSLTLGLLSFGGCYALAPSIEFGLTSFSLASLYEGEIYFQNIKQALKKLFDPNHFDNQLAEDVIKQILENEYRQLLETKYKLKIQNDLSGFIDEDVLAKDIRQLSDDEYKLLKSAILNQPRQAPASLSDASQCIECSIPQANTFECSINKDIPLFFIDYQRAQHKSSLLKSYKDPTPAQILASEKAEKDLEHMQHFFYLALGENTNIDEPYATELTAYLMPEEKENNINAKELIEKANRKKILIKFGFICCAAASTIFSLGSVYLILETLAVLSFITLPLPIIIGLSVICGIATAALTANSLADMIWNETLSKWYNDIEIAIKDTDNPAKAWLLSIGSVVLIGLAACLTVFTWGTWWTITDEIKKIPNLLKNIPTFITKTLLPSVSAAATLIFTLENTKNSLDLMLKVVSNVSVKSQNFINQKIESFQDFSAKFQAQEIPRYQLLNPFNFLIYLIEMPLKVIGFIAHIASVSVTTNRIPYVPMAISMLFAFASELFEDLHYFFFSDDSDSDNQCSHNHSNDIPTRFIHWALSPLYYLSYAWHSKGKLWLSEPDNLYNFWKTDDCCDVNSNNINACANVNCQDASFDTALSSIPPTSTYWQQNKILMQLNEKIDSLPTSDTISRAKKTELEKISAEIKSKIEQVDHYLTQKPAQINTAIKIRKNIKSYLEKPQDDNSPLSQHRNFWQISGNTSSIDLLDTLASECEPLLKKQANFTQSFI